MIRKWKDSEGIEYKAKRDLQGFGYIYRKWGSQWMPIGHSGYDWFLDENEIPKLCKELGVFHPQQEEPEACPRCEGALIWDDCNGHERYYTCEDCGYKTAWIPPDKYNEAMEARRK